MNDGKEGNWGWIERKCVVWVRMSVQLKNEVKMMRWLMKLNELKEWRSVLKQHWKINEIDEKIGGLIQKTRECAETTATGEEAEEEAVRWLE